MQILQNQYVVLPLIAVGIFTFYMAAVIMFKRDIVRDRVRRIAPAMPTIEPEKKRSEFATLVFGLLRLLGITPEEITASRERALKLQQAGLFSDHAVAKYLFVKIILQPMLLLGAVIMMAQLALYPTTDVLDMLYYVSIAALLLFLGLRGADTMVANQRNRRHHQLQRAFPDALDLLLVCIESGLGLDAALARVCRELGDSHPSVVAELDRMRLELAVLGDRVQALQNLADRTGLSSFRALVSALIQTEKFGTSLADTLRVLAEDQRYTRLMTAENKAARLPALITLPLILCIMPAFMMIVMGPPIVKIREQGGIFGGQ